MDHSGHAEVNGWMARWMDGGIGGFLHAEQSQCGYGGGVGTVQDCTGRHTAEASTVGVILLLHRFPVKEPGGLVHCYQSHQPAVRRPPGRNVALSLKLWPLQAVRWSQHRQADSSPRGWLARDLGLLPAYLPESCDGQTVVSKVSVRLRVASTRILLHGKRRPKDTQRHDTDSAATEPARQCRAAMRKRAHGTAAADAGVGVCLRVLRTTVDPSSHCEQTQRWCVWNRSRTICICIHTSAPIATTQRRFKPCEAWSEGQCCSTA